MPSLCTVEFKPGTKEELLPNFDNAFPHIITRASIHDGECAPWHWHKAVELFYVVQGTLEYVTPNTKYTFTQGMGGLVNSNVLHKTKGYRSEPNDCHFLHLFDPALIAGSTGSRIEEKYILPLTTAAQIELLAFDSKAPGQNEILKLLHHSFELDKNRLNYEIQLRNLLSEIWLRILNISAPQLNSKTNLSLSSAQIKEMLAFIHTNYAQKLSVKEIAASACVSERSCYDLFRKTLRTTPIEYLNSYRLRIACQLLTQTDLSITSISCDCGMNNSYFCQFFREATGFTPLEYRRVFQRQYANLNDTHFR